MTREQLIRALERLVELSEEEGAALVSHGLLVEILRFLKPEAIVKYWEF